MEGERAYETHFSNRLFGEFKCRYRLKFYEACGEGGDADVLTEKTDCLLFWPAARAFQGVSAEERAGSWDLTTLRTPRHDDTRHILRLSTMCQKRDCKYTGEASAISDWQCVVVWLLKRTSLSM